MSQTLTRTGMVVPSADGSDSVHLETDLRTPSLWLETYGLIVLPAGLLAARPAAGTYGRIYRATDTGLETVLYFDDGAVWRTIGAGAPTDPAPGTAGLRTLGSGPDQAAPGDSTAAGIAQAAAGDLRDWGRPGLEVPGLATTITSVSAGPTTVVAAPGTGRRIVKSLLLVPSAAGMVVTITLAGTTLGVVAFPSAVPQSLDVCLPVAATETLQVTTSGGTAGVVASYGDRPDAAVDRLGYTSSSAVSGTLVAASTARTVSTLWLANVSATATATTTLTIGGVTLPTITMPPRSIISTDEFAITSSQAIAWAGDGTNPITYLAVGR